MTDSAQTHVLVPNPAGGWVRVIQIVRNASDSAMTQDEQLLLVQHERIAALEEENEALRVELVDSQLAHGAEMNRRITAEQRAEGLCKMLTELDGCGAIDNWLRVSDDLRARVLAAIAAQQGSGVPSE